LSTAQKLDDFELIDSPSPSLMAPVICYVFYVIFNILSYFLMIYLLTLFLFLFCLFSFNNSKQSSMIMKSCASVGSGTALASMAVVTASVLSAKANPGFPVDRPNSENLSNVDDTADSGITQVVVNGNYYQRVDKDDTPRSNLGPCTLLGDHVYKVFEDDIEHHGIVVDSFLEKDSWIEVFQVKYDDGQIEDLYPDHVLLLDKPRRRITGNSIAGTDNDVEKEAAQDAPGKYFPFLSTHEAYDHSVSPYPNPSTGFLPDNPDSGKPWILVGGPNSGKLRNMDDTEVSESKQGVVVTNY
jgi:hypothetical protein